MARRRELIWILWLILDAIRLQRQAIFMVTMEGRTDLLPRLEANLERYLAGQTCCAP